MGTTVDSLAISANSHAESQSNELEVGHEITDNGRFYVDYFRSKNLHLLKG